MSTLLVPRTLNSYPPSRAICSQPSHPPALPSSGTHTWATENSGPCLRRSPLLNPETLLKMGDETMRRTLYVGNLPDDITTKELNDEFRKFGRIVR